ncbi:hypothetical protein [Anaerosphaera multitolerans]|uniref:Uncharacterized protein n=1 Tax=Anaerosphaera multitolerans TaxID=2487351 RepID=A0A437S6N5_9FIRM|nr:hypothetical protein [Anaerosphaera multitolerans]RVU54654.1 hypothetical protein EF514_06000 [Anaerosphaera multitolerans]
MIKVEGFYKTRTLNIFLSLLEEEQVIKVDIKGPGLTRTLEEEFVYFVVFKVKDDKELENIWIECNKRKYEEGKKEIDNLIKRKERYLQVNGG